MSGEDSVVVDETPVNQEEDVQVIEAKEATESARPVDVIAAVYASHGGDPRTLDLGKCLLVAKLPSSFVNDPFEVFSECVYELLCEEFNVNRDAIEQVVRVPKLQTDAESSDNALRAIVMFKSRVHKHRVFAQKKLSTLDGSLSVTALDEIPKEMLEVDDIEVADEVVDEDGEGHPEATEEKEAEEEEEKGEGDQPTEGEKEKPEGEAKNGSAKKKTKTETAKGEKKEEKPEHVKKAYIDEDAKAPFEVNWDGAPEFQWKLCTVPGDSRRLTLENVMYSDLRNPFIYRVMAKAESVDVSFPMRFNIQGNKQMYGKITMNFQFANQTMQEAVTHLIYIRCSGGRRIKIYLPQTPQAMKQKDELEEKLGRVIQPTPRMYQLVLKELPKDQEYTVENAKTWFPEQADKITAFEKVEDELGHPCALVTFSTIDAVIDAHSAHSFISVPIKDEKTAKIHVFLRGAEAHFGSFLTRWDQKKVTQVTAKRPGIADVQAPAAKRGRGGAIRGATAPRGSSSFRGSPRGGSSRGGRGGSSYRGQSTPSPFTAGSNMRGGPSRYQEDSYRRRDADPRSEMWRHQQEYTSDRGPSRFGTSYPDNRAGDSRRDSYSHGLSQYGYDRR